MADKISLEFDTGSGATHLSKSESVLAAQATENYYQLLGQFKPLRELILIAPMQVPESVFDISVARKAGYFNYPPVGLLYIASVAKHCLLYTSDAADE